MTLCFGNANDQEEDGCVIISEIVMLKGLLSMHDAQNVEQCLMKHHNITKK